jgi:hypothetical protein
MPDDGKAGKGDDQKALCFVIGVIGKDGTTERRHADLLLNAVIKHVLQQEEFRYIVKRADEDADPGMITDRMVSDIINAGLVVADLTDLNPNAFYELGIRHATGKPTIHVARAGTPLPFDTSAHRTIFVDLTDWHSIEQARERLASSARAIKVPGYKVSNPITQANASFEMRQSKDPLERTLAQVQERLAAIEKAASAHGDVQIIAREISHSDRADTKLAYDLAELLKTKQYDAAASLYGRTSHATAAGAKRFIDAMTNGTRVEATYIHCTNTNSSADEAQIFVELLLHFMTRD